MRVGIVGSRDYPKLGDVVAMVDSLPRDTIVVSGGARGVDTCAERRAKEIALKVDIFPADWDLHGTRAGPLRNRRMIPTCDRVIAYDFCGSTGTADAIALAQHHKIPVTVVTWAPSVGELSRFTDTLQILRGHAPSLRHPAFADMLRWLHSPAVLRLLSGFPLTWDDIA